MAAQEANQTQSTSMQERFSFANPRTSSESPNQKASIVTIERTAAASMANASTSADSGNSGEQQSANSNAADRAGQEPSLVQFAITGQEPSLAQSSTSADGTALQQDGSGLSSSNTGSMQQSMPAACSRNGSASSSVQQSSSSEAAQNTPGQAAVEQQLQQLPAVSSDGQQGLQEATDMSQSETASVSDTGAVEGTADAPVETAAARQPDAAYFADGMRAIDVEVDCGPGTACKLLHVLIDVSALGGSTKPFLGGYRHKHNGAIYHHACSQTPKAQKQGAKQAPAAAEQQQTAPGRKQKLCRETQTVKAASTSSQTVREAATQMARPGLELDCSGDRVLIPRPYTTADEVGNWRQAAAVTIQRYSRGWMARRRAAALRGIKAERDGFLSQAAAEREAAAREQRRCEVERRTHPLTKSDFELLSTELEAWRQQQTAAIKAAAQQQDPQGKGFDEAAALQLLLAKETRLLQTLDKLRVNAKHEVKALNTHKVLNHLAQPKTWTLSNGKKVMVHTPTTVRAAELQQLYRGLTLPNLTLDERLDVLLHVKWAVKEFDCALTRELVELIDREADLLNRGRSPKTLDGLRRRIAGAFLAFCKTPAFNPEAAKLQLVPGAPTEPETFEYVEECVE